MSSSVLHRHQTYTQTCRQNSYPHKINEKKEEEEEKEKERRRGGGGANIRMVVKTEVGKSSIKLLDQGIRSGKWLRDLNAKFLVHWSACRTVKSLLLRILKGPTTAHPQAPGLADLTRSHLASEALLS